eukprot:15036928-Alexandrium_andersonii.AAC.1
MTWGHQHARARIPARAERSHCCGSAHLTQEGAPAQGQGPGICGGWTVSYTHLTLPTICSV